MPALSCINEKPPALREVFLERFTFEKGETPMGKTCRSDHMTFKKNQ